METITVDKFYKLYIHVESIIAPNLSQSEAAVYRYFFSCSIAVGQPSCKASLRDIEYATNMSQLTISRAIRSLKLKGCIEIVKKPGPYSPGTYRVSFPSDLGKKVGEEIRRKELPLYPALLEGSYRENDYEGLIDMLDPEDKNYLNLILKSLSPAKQMRLRSEAIKSGLSGEAAEKKYMELVVLNEFGPLRLEKYAHIKRQYADRTETARKND